MTETLAPPAKMGKVPLVTMKVRAFIFWLVAVLTNGALDDNLCGSHNILRD